VTVVNKIQEFINSKNISKYKFMKDTGVAQRTAYDLCNNPTQLPSPDVLRKICNTYQIQPGEILEWLPYKEFETRFGNIKLTIGVNNETSQTTKT
jgi:DNA-binding Xre family transcriptional regulator